jgi:threonine aldolase
MNVVPLNFIQGWKINYLKWYKWQNNSKELDEAITGKGVVHHTQPCSVSITQVCETGEVYQLDEIKQISEVAHKHNLNMHMDGARFANALTVFKLFTC